MDSKRWRVGGAWDVVVIRGSQTRGGSERLLPYNIMAAIVIRLTALQEMDSDAQESARGLQTPSLCCLNLHVQRVQ